MSARGTRVARGLAAAAVATFVAALFHVAGGGAAPSILALTLSLTFSGLAGIALIGRRRALWRTAAAVGVSQFLFHALFTLGTTGGGRFEGMSGHIHPGVRLLYVAGDGVSSTASDDWAMWVAHAVAIAITVVMLRRGESALHSLLTVLGRTALTLGRLLQLPVPFMLGRAAAISLTPWTEPSAPRLLLLLIGSLRHRGPPLSMGTPAF